MKKNRSADNLEAYKRCLDVSMNIEEIKNLYWAIHVDTKRILELKLLIKSGTSVVKNRKLLTTVESALRATTDELKKHKVRLFKKGIVL